MSQARIGTIGWIDLTVDDVAGLRDFYAAVTGWTPEPTPMGDYDDFTMMTPGGEAVAGVCHARAGNTGTPPQWMIYINVEDLDASIEACEARGGKVIVPTRTMGAQGRYCMIEDPAGAVAALFEPPPKPEDRG